MAGKTCEAALQEKLDQIKTDYLALVDKIKSENVKAAADLEKKLLKDEEDFKDKQERDRREFEARLEREKEEFQERQIREREISDREASERLSQAEEFINNVRSPVVKHPRAVGDVDIGNELECPVCFQEMKPPVHIWQCAQGHPVCEPCKQRPELRHCPTCRQRIVGRATLVEKIAAQVFTSSAADKDVNPGGGSASAEESSTGMLDTSPETSPVSSPEPSFRPRLPTYFMSLRTGTRIGNEDFSLNSLRESLVTPRNLASMNPVIYESEPVFQESEDDIREFDFPGDSHQASFGFLD